MAHEFQTLDPYIYITLYQHYRDRGQQPSDGDYILSLSQLLHHYPQLETVEVDSSAVESVEDQPDTTKNYVNVSLKKFGCDWHDINLDLLAHLSLHPNLNTFAIHSIFNTDTIDEHITSAFQQHQNQRGIVNTISIRITSLEYKSPALYSTNSLLHVSNLYTNLAHLTLTNCNFHVKISDVSICTWIGILYNYNNYH